MDMQKKPLGLSRIYIILCWVCEVVVLDFAIGCCFILNTDDTFGLPHHRKKIRGAPNSQIFGAIHKPVSADLALSTKGLGNLKAFSIGWYMSLFFLFCPAPERDLGNAGMARFPVFMRFGPANTRKPTTFGFQLAVLDNRVVFGDMSLNLTEWKDYVQWGQWLAKFPGQTLAGFNMGSVSPPHHWGWLNVHDCRYWDLESICNHLESYLLECKFLICSLACTC